MLWHIAWFYTSDKYVDDEEEECPWAREDMRCRPGIGPALAGQQPSRCYRAAIPWQHAHKKRKKAMPSSLKALSIAWRIAYTRSYSISCLPSIVGSCMTSVALVVVVSRNRCCGGAAERRSAKIPSLEVRIRRQRCEQQQPHKTLVISGSGASNGA